MQARLLVELILAEPQLLVSLGEKRSGDEGQGMLDDAFLGEEIGDVADAVAGRDIDDLVRRQRTGRIESVLANPEPDTADDHQQDQYGENGIAHDDQRMP